MRFPSLVFTRNLILKLCIGANVKDDSVNNKLEEFVFEIYFHGYDFGHNVKEVGVRSAFCHTYSPFLLV